MQLKKSTLLAALVASFALVSAPTAWAQGEDEDDKIPTEETEGGDEAAAESEDAPAEEPAPVEEPAATVETSQSNFKIKRGLFASGDLGIYLTFGGVNTNNPQLPKRSTSNIQPYASIMLGYDIASSETYSVHLGLRFGAAMSGGAGRAEPTDPVDVATTQSNDYGVINGLLDIGAGFLLSDRLALTFRANVGGGFLDPDPTISAEDVSGNGGKAAFAIMFGGAVGLELFTLLNDFSVGLNLGFLGALKDGFIPGAFASIPVKYTF